MKNFFKSHYGSITSSKEKIAMQKEVFRKAIHFASSLIPFFLVINKPLVLVLLGIVTLVYVIAECLRIKGYSIFIISHITDMASRQRDKNRFVLGPVTLAMGIFFTALLFPIQEATIGIFALAFGDGIASLAGKLFGHKKIPFTKGKTFVGSIACFCAVFVSTIFIIGNWYEALIFAFFATIFEMVPLRDYDNLLIPIAVAGVAMLLPQII